MGEFSVDIPLSAAPYGQRPARVRLLVHPPDADPHATPAPLLDLRGAPDRDPAVEPIQVLEGREYRYEVLDAPEGCRVSFDPEEVFDPDDASGWRGRLRPGLHTGTMPVTVRADDEVLGTFALEVRSRKLDYLRHYRWMLRDLAEVMAELVMERFAASEQRFGPDARRDATTLYQRFALLQALLLDEHLTGALRRVLHRPHVTWEARAERSSTRRGVRASSGAIRELMRPGPRRPFTGGPTRLATLPTHITSARTAPEVDNAPNRFVKFALTRWRDVTAKIHEVLAAVPASKETAPVRRGVLESRALLERLDALLGERVLRRVGRLERFPSDSQVLQKGAGYRAIYRAYIQFELAAQVSWDAQNVYGAGQRDVATLYEYWVFVQLVQLVSDLCARPLDLSQMLSRQKGGLTVGLRHDVTFDGVATAANGREMHIEVHFNRTFGASAGSWTRGMRPDCSLRIRPIGAARDVEDVWLHFDAKYRVHGLEELFEETEAGERRRHIRGEARGEDLLKMHAYRDAIRRSAGAYVLYPGDAERAFLRYHEVLPGLGAFPLRPDGAGAPEGTRALRGFLEGALEHVADQLTQRGRERYWSARAHASPPEAPSPLPLAPFLPRPAADTLVLLGYVRSEAHWAWVREQLSYNLRADGRRGSVGLGARELAADLVMLYGEPMTHAQLFGVGGQPRLMTRRDMRAAGYPEPRSAQYFVLPLQVLDAGPWAERIEARRLRELVRDELAAGRPEGAPCVTSWLRLARALGPARV